MNARQQRFVKEYLVDLNATQAAIRAGYGAKTANKVGPKLLVHIGVRRAVDAALTKRAAKLDVKADEVLQELALMAKANMLDYMRLDEDHPDVDFSKLTRDQTAAIQEITIDSTGGTGDGERKQVMRTRFKLADKLHALELLGKHQNLFNESRVADFTAAIMIADRLREARKGINAPPERQALPAGPTIDAEVVPGKEAEPEPEIIGNS